MECSYTRHLNVTTKYLDFTISVACGITCGINSNDDKYNSSSQTIGKQCMGRGHSGNICMLVQIVRMYRCLIAEIKRRASECALLFMACFGRNFG